MKEAAIDGYFKAMCKYALYLLSKDTNQNNNENIDESLFFLKKASDKGDIDSIFEYGKTLIDYKKNEKELREGAKYLLIAAENDHSEYMRIYAEILLKGNGVEINIDESIKYYKMAIQKGNAYT